MLDRRHLLHLLACHSTPGDEAEVWQLLEQHWHAAGLTLTPLGDYALTATTPARRRRPILLITAHMDSPGFAVDRLPAARGSRKAVAGLTRLGGAAFPGQQVPGLLKTRSGKTPVLICKHAKPGNEPDFSCEPLPAARHLPPDLRHGDRVCFAGTPELTGDKIVAPFLDNRLGCWLLTALAPQLTTWKTPWQIVLAATGSEEFGGFGASVLAHHVRADLAIVLDATYASKEQQVHLGGGPVLTLSDASVLLSPARRDQIADALSTAGIPLQTEVYNFSGTDARAFPRLGQTCPVLPLLLATTGNHSPQETADCRDADHLLAAITCLATRQR